jgi:hypothetical protein
VGGSGAAAGSSGAAGGAGGASGAGGSCHVPLTGTLVNTDLNGDGLNDWVTLVEDGYSNLQVNIYRARGDGTFSCPGSDGYAQVTNAFMYVSSPPITGFPTFLLGDFTGDGRQDMLVPASVGPVGSTDHTVIWIVVSDPKDGTGLKAVTTNTGIVLGQFGYVEMTSTSDVDKDGHLDFSTSIRVQQTSSPSSTFNQTLVVYGNGDGTFRCISSETMYCPESCQELAATSACDATTGVFDGPCTRLYPTLSCH